MDAARVSELRRAVNDVADETLGPDDLMPRLRRDLDNARWLADEVAKLGPYELVSDGSGIPAFAFGLRDEAAPFTVFDVSELMRTRGWLVPAYRFPPALDDLAVLRVVVRNGFSRDLAGILVADLRRVTGRLAEPHRLPLPDGQGATAFHH